MSNKLKPTVPAWKCSFCAGANRSPLSGEHLWSKWSAKYFPRTSHDKRIEDWRSVPVKSSAPTETKIRERTGHTTTKKLRVVCVVCNNGWMKSIEDAAKPHLEQMLQGHPAELSEANRDSLAAWVTLKMMVADQSFPTDVVFTFEQRSAFMETRTIPELMRIRAFNYGGEWWRSSMRQDSYLVGTSATEKPSGPLTKNTKSLTLGFGSVLFWAFFTQITNFDDFAQIEFDGALHVWPHVSGTSHWPLHSPIDDMQASYISQTLDRFGRSPKVIALPG